MKEVILAKTAGFCFGVKRAVDTVYECLEKDDNIYTYGEIIHNEYVVNDLMEKGVKVIHSIEEINQLNPGTVVIRSHGVEKKVYSELEKAGMKIVDATCPFVLKIHQIVEEKSKAGKQIIIIGDRNHPEVQGIMGWCETKAAVIDKEEDIDDLELENRNIHIVSQTTFQYNKLTNLIEIIKEKGYNVDISNTICNATEVRQNEIREIARNVDAVLVVGGSNSSNTRKLYEVSKRECGNTFLIGGKKDICPYMIEAAERVGITAGASTPNNIIQEVYNSVRTEF